MSTGQILGAVAGAIVTYVTENPSYGMMTYAAVSGAYAYTHQPDREGPRLEDLRQQLSVYGAAIPFEYGVNRHAGTVIWPQILEAQEHAHSESTKGGPEQKTYTYTMSFAILVCEGPIDGIRRIWANKKLIYDISTANTGATQDPMISGIRFYNGTETQEVDPLIEATDGASPAYLGYAYVVFENYDVTELNGRLPQFEFEVVVNGTPSSELPTYLGPGEYTILYTDPDTLAQQLWSVDGSSLYVYDVLSGDLVQTVSLPSPASSITYDGSQIWVGYSNTGWFLDPFPYGAQPVNPVTFALGSPINFGYHGIVSEIATVVYSSVLYGFTNNGTGAGARIHPADTDAGIGVPNWAYQTLSMSDRGTFAVTGLGNWISVVDGPGQALLATVHNTDWGDVQSHRMAYDSVREAIYWASAGEPNVYRLDLNSYALTTLITGVSGDVHGLHFNSATDTLYVHNGEGDLQFHNPDDGSLIITRADCGVMVGQQAGNSIDVGSESYYFIGEHTTGLWRIPIGGSIDPARVTLSSIVTDICARADLDSSKIDVTELTDMVDGYIVPRQMTARAALEPLQTAYYFDVVDGEKLRFVKRGSSVTTTIPMDDRAAHMDGEEVPAHLEIRRAFDTELPIQCDVEYPDIGADHQIGNQYDRRITKDTRHRINLQLAIVMPASKAKEIARCVLYQAWQKQTFRWTTTRKYAYLEPTDIVSLPTNDATYRARITNRRDQPNGLIEWEGAIESLEVYTQSGDDAITPDYSPQTIFEPATTVLELLDIPIQRDEDKDLGFYIAMCGTTSSWPGAEVFRSADDGSTYNSILVHSVKTPIGIATTALGDFTGGEVFDDGNTVRVQMTAGASLISYTEAQVLDGSGIFALGAPGRWEILHYTTATLVSDGVYELSGLLRGRRGTEWAMSGHEVGDTFVLGSESGWRLYNVPSTDLNVQRLYKAPAFRTTLSAAEANAMTDRAIRRRPYSVAHLKAEPLNDGGYTVSWIHRSLVGGSWSTGFAVPLDATFTGFSVTISSIDGVVLRQFTTTSEAFPYAADEIEVDFGAIPPVILIRIAQRNSDYGDGVGATLRTDTGAVIYDFTDPFSGDYIPPDTTKPPTPPTAGDPIPPGNQWFGPDYWAPALWDGSKFIASNVYQKAVISTGRIWTSTDGLSFTQLAANNMTIPLGIAAYHGGVYVNQWERSKPWYSSDLQAWTEGAFSSYPSGYPYDSESSFSKIIHDGTRFIAVRRNGEIVSSSSGATWDHKCNVTTPVDGSGYFAGDGSEVLGLAFGSGVYVAVGYGSIWMSSNYDGPYAAQTGVPSVSHGSGPAEKAYLYSVTFNPGDGYFYAVGAKKYYFEPSGYFVSTPVIIRSTDGETWVDVTPTPTIAPTYSGCEAFQFFSVSGGYVVLGTNVYLTSADGSTWTEHPLSPYNENQLYSYQVGASNGSIVATQEYQWLLRNVSSAGRDFIYADQYRKPITFDGSVFDPTLDSPYP
jgi:hypothetical protein